MLRSATNADMAQSVAHFIGSEEVPGSIPGVSTRLKPFGRKGLSLIYLCGNKNMKKIIIIPDSFKGSLTSEQVASIISEEIDKVSDGKVEIVKLPIADGGEGSTDCIINSLGGEKIKAIVKSPENKDIDAYYGIIKKGDRKTAVIEIAESSGITKQTSYNAKDATTYGFGQLIKNALDNGCSDFLLCLGGSATTDCGLGMAAALGVKFMDNSGCCFVPTGGTLNRVTTIDISGIDSRIDKASFTVMCDVDNPLYGKRGAAYVYGPQKGADAEDVILMDLGLKNVSGVLCKLKCQDLSDHPGAGAAGGAGYGCMTFLNAKMKSGIESMLEIVEFDNKVKDCDLIVTGEGRVDEQSFMGKVLSGITAHSLGKKVTAFCGCLGLSEYENTDIEYIKSYKNIDIIEVGYGIDVEESIKNAGVYLRKAAKAYFEYYIK